MQARAVPVALLLIALAFAGCVNTPKDSATVDPAKQGTDGGSDGGGTGISTPVVKVQAPLSLAVTTTAAKWVEPKTTVSFKTTGGAGWTYLWAAGPLVGAAPSSAATLDTGSKNPATDYLAPGQSKALVFSQAGIYEMHCHPHPFMLSNVTVVDGYTGPKEVHVQILDGEKLGEYRYVPEHVVVAPGTTVVYTNNGTQPHTATLSKAAPGLKKLDLAGNSGDVTLDGNGWQRVRVVAVDADGRIGVADHEIYVAALPKFTSEPKTLDFAAGGVPEDAGAIGPFSFSFVLEYNATLDIKATVQDAPAQNGAPLNNAQIDVHVTKAGESQDVLTCEAKAECVLTGSVAAGTYNVKVVPKQGVGIKGTIEVAGLYEDVQPPAPAAGGDGHGHKH